MNTGFEWFRRYGLFLSFGLLLLVTMLSLMPADHLPSVSGSDKVRHALAYFVIGLPVAWLKPAHWYWLLAGIFVWSGVIELLQPLSNRFAEWLDLLANGVGVMLAYAVSLVLIKFGDSFSSK